MYTYDDFLNIIKTLRSPEGCPWDREQTHASLKPCMMEEAAEAVSAIRIYDKTGNYENLVEELGDVLLQVVMHAQIAREEGLFSMEDVIDHVAAKMVRRHPHVFTDNNVDSKEQITANWDEIKKKEKEGKTYIESPLREIPRELPALTRAPKVLKRIDKMYEKQPGYDEAVEALQRAAAALEKVNTGDETVPDLAGDALMALSQIARTERFSQEQILADRMEDLIERLEPTE